jgi:hypothetical protein
VPSKKPDYVNQGVRPLLRNGSQTHVPAATNVNKGIPMTITSITEEIAQPTETELLSSRTNGYASQSYEHLDKCLLFGTPRTYFRGITPVKQAISSKQSVDKF